MKSEASRPDNFGRELTEGQRGVLMNEILGGSASTKRVHQLGTSPTLSFEPLNLPDMRCMLEGRHVIALNDRPL